MREANKNSRKQARKNSESANKKHRNKDEKAAVMEMVNLIKKNELYIKNIYYLLSGN